MFERFTTLAVDTFTSCCHAPSIPTFINAIAPYLRHLFRPGLIALSILAIVTLAGVNAYAQGYVITFTTVGAPDDKRIWVNDTGTVGDGVRAGAGFEVGLFWGPSGTRDDRDFVQVGASARFVTVVTQLGTFFGGHRTIITPNGIAAVQARAWSVLPGVPNSYAGVLASGQGSVGKGPIFDYRLTTPLEPDVFISRAEGWQGFSITPVPEPSTITVVLLGIGALLLMRRR